MVKIEIPGENVTDIFDNFILINLYSYAKTNYRYHHSLYFA